MLTLFGFRYRFVDGADKQESALGQIVVLALDDFLKAANGFLNRYTCLPCR